MDVADLKPAMLRADRLAAWDDESVANLKPKECALCREDKHALHPVRLLDGCREATAPLVKWRRSNDVLGRVCRVAFLHSRLAYPFLCCFSAQPLGFLGFGWVSGESCSSHNMVELYQ